MKLLLFIDKVYSKIMIFFILLAIPFTIVSVYLYMKLPNIIPVQWGITLIPSNWGNKSTIFIFPIVLMTVPAFMSRKIISSQENSVAERMTEEMIPLVVLAVILIMMIGAYYLYFKII
ncbi:DUF1648 domain-containing protein [Lactococcus lactis]|uniref:DUF1648 domain-containing protein n=1 Tax=Lactococcus lactis TaxID=1358 RepID=A0A9X4NGY2_9LACT|nr:DUF1648 domain-containing protein [Lactococcus lactis]MDG4983861.1 DUF1648 domain-containing protein [Lactococcus lactis]